MHRRKNRRSSRKSTDSNLVTPSAAEVRGALAALGPDLAWEEMQDGLRPVFVRRRPLPPGVEPPVRVKLALGLHVALGVDIGPAFMYVGESMLDSWAITPDAAYERAMANLRAAMASERHIEMEYGTVGGAATWWYQSRGGLASGLLLVEDELVNRYGDEPRLLIAPMRNLLIAAPFEADRELISWIRDDIAYEDPNGLDLPIFALVDGRLSIDSGSAVGLGTTIH